MLDEQVEPCSVERARALVVTGRDEDVRERDVRVPAIAGRHHVEKLERDRTRARSLVHVTVEHERPCLLDREHHFLGLRQLGAEQRASALQQLERGFAVARFDLGEREQVVRHRDVRGVLRALEDVERATRVPRGQRRLATHAVEPGLRPVHARGRDRILQLAGECDDPCEQPLRIGVRAVVDQRVREQDREAELLDHGLGSPAPRRRADWKTAIADSRSPVRA